MKKKLLIEGMSCGHCVNHVKTALTEDIQGVEFLEVSLDEKYALVDVNENVTDADLKLVIEDLDFELKGIE